LGTVSDSEGHRPDDILDEQDALSETAMENTWEWYTSGPRQRLQPNGSIIVINTRWKTDDLSGRLLRQQGQLKSDQWEVIEFPAIIAQWQSVVARVLEP
jgi:hypothetical protein